MYQRPHSENAVIFVFAFPEADRERVRFDFVPGIMKFAEFAPAGYNCRANASSNSANTWSLSAQRRM